MGYMHIDNLYKDMRIFEFPSCYALEKIHGTSAHIGWKRGDGVRFFSGGEKHENFVKLFNVDALFATFDMLGGQEIIVFGEAYGGKMQGMSKTYGPDLKFIAFDVKVDGKWLTVPHAYLVARSLGLEFVDFNEICTKLEYIDAERDKPSVQAKRNGIVEDKQREGIVLRPLQEAYDHRGNRIITKHKNDAFKETRTQREVNPDKLKVLADANAIATEWVTDMRLYHVLPKINPESVAPLGPEDTKAVIFAMIEDIRREAAGEILESKEATKAIGSATARLFKKYLQERLKGVQENV